MTGWTRGRGRRAEEEGGVPPLVVDDDSEAGWGLPGAWAGAFE